MCFRIVQFILFYFTMEYSIISKDLTAHQNKHDTNEIID